MKTYSIGREPTCNIIINDPQKIISRTHAIINVADNGKLTIIDQSINGTYINGMRIASNVPVPVTRKDKVSFAHVATLDWNNIPASGMCGNVVKWVLGAIIGVALALLLIFAVPWGRLFSPDIPVGGGGTMPIETMDEGTTGQSKEPEDIDKKDSETEGNSENKSDEGNGTQKFNKDNSKSESVSKDSNNKKTNKNSTEKEQNKDKTTSDNNKKDAETYEMPD